MPRKLRMEYPGTMYRVMRRGDQRDDIFLNDEDRHDFIKTLAETCEKTTTLTVKQIAQRLYLGQPKGARTNLHKFLNGGAAETSQIQLDIS